MRGPGFSEVIIFEIQEELKGKNQSNKEVEEIQNLRGFGKGAPPPSFEPGQALSHRIS